MKNNYKFVIAYDGTRYFGWQRLKNKETIQGKLETVLGRMCNCPVEINGAGRTDAGVHAKAMVANALFDTPLNCDEIRDYMNHYLPDDICIREVFLVPMRFHARYQAVEKTYCYTCYVGNTKPVFDRKYVTILEREPDLALMQQAVEFLEGEHDFAAFCGNPHMKKSTVRCIKEIQIVQSEDYLQFYFRGDGFLQNMVRILVGTLLEVGYKKIPVAQVQTILEQKNRKLAGPKMPPEGLCLEQVEYLL